MRRAHVSVHEKVRQVRRKSCIICFVGIGCCGRGGGCRFLSACCRREILSCCAYVKISCGDSKWKVTQLLPVTVSLPYRVWSAAWHILFPCARLYSEYIWKSFHTMRDISLNLESTVRLCISNWVRQAEKQGVQSGGKIFQTWSDEECKRSDEESTRDGCFTENIPVMPLFPLETEWQQAEWNGAESRGIWLPSSAPSR